MGSKQRSSQKEKVTFQILKHQCHKTWRSWILISPQKGLLWRLCGWHPWSNNLDWMESLVFCINWSKTFRNLTLQLRLVHTNWTQCWTLSSDTKVKCLTTYKQGLGIEFFVLFKSKGTRLLFYGFKKVNRSWKISKTVQINVVFLPG